MIIIAEAIGTLVLIAIVVLGIKTIVDILEEHGKKPEQKQEK